MISCTFIGLSLHALNSESLATADQTIELNSIMSRSAQGFLRDWRHHILPKSISTRIVIACRRGQVLLATVNEQTMVPFVSTQLNNMDLALSLARRGNLPGAEALVGQNFNMLFASGKFKEAAEAAADSPKARLSDPHLGILMIIAGLDEGNRSLLRKHALPFYPNSGCLSSKVRFQMARKWDNQELG